MNAVPFQVERFAELTQWFESLGAGHDTPLNLYALVDGALSPDMLQFVTQRKAAWQCLYPDTMLEAASPAIAPYLVELRLDDSGHAALARALLRQSEHMDVVLWVASQMPLHHLTHYLHPFAEVELADERHALLRYYDPLILESLLETLTHKQHDRVIAPFRALRYWRGGWQEVEGLDRDPESLDVAVDNLQITAEQQQRLAMATLAETVYYEIVDELLPPMSNVDGRTCTAHTRELLDRAYDRYQLRNLDDLTLFTLVGLNVNREFDAHPAINAKLDARERANKSLQEVFLSIPADVWESVGACT
ncbi:DUF4123 domain-containing protein [Burkholderia vietnamiensis]|uniref:DUF4123 domain-containing protein n=1 Tax=Burkholderia vietnamiensis TaxID=60552 RepID=A0AAW7T4M0_BURVI|nr:DUF4123 domain-containing protein [Burkholderia vietnamiensis]KVF66150.1 hypothetical protein WJ17_18885 [Burkholderia vietnamiensis]MBR8082373.1 DUF4123 domain-containing protein [Burkholderia vietnamiensis]MBR8193317.1 DUF4123 domain-containing protein [Burkholderia vietnamiensis]MBR8231028.1 DUF4123 domain-containing protein [Burkholderia vietnamiensis]MCA7945872.1 DUF4123 domain-containing protein [Burkholderia vietnamiensis]